VSRLTESDLDDCLAMVQFARGTGETIDEERLRIYVSDELVKAVGTARRERLESLLSAM